LIVICHIAVILIYHSRFLYLVLVTLGLACIHGEFFSRICSTDSHRIPAIVYFGRRGVTLRLSGLEETLSILQLSLMITQDMDIFI